MIDYEAKHNYSMDDFIRERGNPNDPNLDDEKVLLFLSQGKRTPQNEYERNLLKDIEEAKKAGYMIEIPSNI